MRKRVAVTAAVVAAAGLVAAAGAAPPSDGVAGAGTVTFPNFPGLGEATTEQMVVSAHSGPQGEDPVGTMVQHSPLGDVRADVTCLEVDGSSAVVGGTIVSGTYLGRTFSRIAVWIESSGPGANGPDGWTGLIFSTAWEDPCARLIELRPGIPGFAPLSLEEGAFTVIDAP